MLKCKDQATTHSNCWTSYFWLGDEYCRYRFVYTIGEDGDTTVYVDTNKECTEINFLAIGLGLTGAIIAIGLALLITWRILAYLYDKNEYARFLKETKDARFTAVSLACLFGYFLD